MALINEKGLKMQPGKLMSRNHVRLCSFLPEI